jgi:hypothetical protein
MQVLEVWILETPDLEDRESFSIKAGIHYVQVPFKTGPNVLHYEYPTWQKQAIKVDICEVVETNYDACFHLNAFMCTRRPQEFIAQGYYVSVFVSIFQ